jgi:hypothetical protein
MAQSSGEACAGQSPVAGIDVAVFELNRADLACGPERANLRRDEISIRASDRFYFVLQFDLDLATRCHYELTFAPTRDDGPGF